MIVMNVPRSGQTNATTIICFLFINAETARGTYYLAGKEIFTKTEKKLKNTFTEIENLHIFLPGKSSNSFIYFFIRKDLFVKIFIVFLFQFSKFQILKCNGLFTFAKS